MTTTEAHAELGTQPGDSPETIRNAYRKRSKKTHPDAGGTQATFKRTVDAYETLTGKTNTTNPTSTPMNSREDWMIGAFRIMQQHADMAGIQIPDARTSVGYGTAGRREPFCVIEPKNTTDGRPQFSSPRRLLETKSS